MGDDRGGGREAEGGPPAPTLPPPAPPPPDLAPFHARAIQALTDLDAWGRDKAGRLNLTWPRAPVPGAREGGEREVPGAERAAQEAAQRERQREVTP